ncbi:MAG: hypothetical protein DDT40_01840 [candidate division WS2 bacterium]|nr:hypothetical protein [Candidatus Psychracetigena formicireducens]
MNLRSFDNIVVCGQKGCGKTFLIKALLPRYKKVFVFDPAQEFEQYPHYVPQTDSPLELEKIAATIWNTWNILFVVSEAELYMPVNKLLPPSVFKIVARGRHRNIGLIADTRRVANLNKTVFGLSEFCFIFRHFSPTDLDYLSKFIPQDCTRLKSLPDYHFWVYHRNQIKIHKPIIPNKL